jgi:NAD(P)H dehydrogenase (quinone)
MILVTGAAGKTSKAIVKARANRGTRVRALVRRPRQIAALKSLGAAEVSVGSFDEANALSSAVTGAQAIYHICPNVSRDEVRFARAVAAAAKAHGVTRFVYHSVLHPQIAAMPHHWEKMRVEEMLIAGDFDVTFMQPTAYMQNILGAWHGIVADGVLVIPYPAATRLSLVDLADVGEAAARVLTTDGHSGAAYQLVGTAPLTQSEVAAAISAALGKTVRIAEETVEAWEERMRGARLGDYERSTLAAMLRYYARHGLIGSPNMLRWLLGREPTGLAQFLGRQRNDGL